MVAPRGKHQQRLGDGIHRVIEQHGAQLFSQWRTPGLAGLSNHPALRFKRFGQRLDVGRFASPVDALKSDKYTAHVIDF